MSGEDVARSRLATWLAGRSVRQVVLGTGGALLLVSGLFGGLREAEPDQPDRLSPGVARTVAPFTLTVERARWTTDLGDAGTTERGRYLVVVATIRTDQERSVDPGVVAAALQLQGQRVFTSEGDDEQDASEDARPQVLVLADTTRMSDLVPGLTYEVVYVWEQSEARPVPRSLRLAAMAHTWRQSSIDDQEGWFDPTVDAVGSVPMTKAKDA